MPGSVVYFTGVCPECIMVPSMMNMRVTDAKSITDQVVQEGDERENYTKEWFSLKVEECH
jgi:hypothetical protein